MGSVVQVQAGSTGEAVLLSCFGSISGSSCLLTLAPAMGLPPWLQHNSKWCSKTLLTLCPFCSPVLEVTCFGVWPFLFCRSSSTYCSHPKHAYQFLVFEISRMGLIFLNGPRVIYKSAYIRTASSLMDNHQNN